MGRLILKNAEREILRGLIRGSTLKSHRDIDGNKVYKLHPLDGPAVEVAWETVSRLKELKLIDSNKKFPAATYLLTEKGRELVEARFSVNVRPLSAKNY